ncbi:hypothetical protein AWC15_16485 [Mycobacterium lacus]|uniref:Uncharacterized protein n=1 Tax=Mycobacterium lacus TaxID=169765 RepID=A0A1X1YJZ4_9MYCO|nr:hypothetical protein AWC15_16485 [Mycobacterium lacus]BBX95814.1 hypothetical protein MLAC_11080 [Mycobacterium lacus]
MLSTRWSRSFGLRAPVVNAPMGGVAGGRLAAAVTAARKELAAPIVADDRRIAGPTRRGG